MRRRRANPRFTSDKDLGWDEIFAKILAEDKLGSQVVDVGWDEPHLASRALYVEFGTRGRPAHPFIRTTFDANRAKYQGRLVELAIAAVDPKGARRSLESVAELFRADLEAATPVDTGELRDGVTIRRGRT